MELPGSSRIQPSMMILMTLGSLAASIVGSRECLGDSVQEIGGDREAWNDALEGFDARVHERLGRTWDSFIKHN